MTSRAIAPATTCTSFFTTTHSTAAATAAATTRRPHAFTAIETTRKPLAFAAILLGFLLLFALAMPAVAQAQPSVKFKMTADVKNTASLTTYPGNATKLKVAILNRDGAKATWNSTNNRVATVKKGVVTAVAPGRCYVKVTVGGSSAKMLVEVTSKKAYQAVQNAFVDKATKIKYSQERRMQRYFRDCSAFVSRCYWDASLGRCLFAIGGAEAKSWALPAADQAMWLKRKGKCVSMKACSIANLRPGDTLYFETQYAGKDYSQWRCIDHAALYVGNGYVMDTGGRGGKGTIGFRWCKYSSTDKTIKFIGRPCP